MGMVDTPVYSEPFKQLAFDLVGLFQKSKKGYRYLLTCVCLATRYPEAVPLKTVTSVEVCEALMEIMCRQGLPDVISTDHGLQFVGTVEPHRSEHQTTELTGPNHEETSRWVQGRHHVVVLFLFFCSFYWNCSKMAKELL